VTLTGGLRTRQADVPGQGLGRNDAGLRGVRGRPRRHRGTGPRCKEQTKPELLLQAPPASTRLGPGTRLTFLSF